MRSPGEIAEFAVSVGKGKAELSWQRQLGLGFLAGMFIALAAVGANTAAAAMENPGVAKLLASVVFPAGLAMVLVAGSELFTGNCLMVMGVLEKKFGICAMLRNWLLVYLGNFAGSVFVAWLVWASGQLSLFGGKLAEATIRTANAKCALSFGPAVALGILCNFLVCIAVWMSFSAKTTAGKIACAFLPVMLFVLAGFEHSVANMYYIPAGLFLAADPAYAGALAAVGGASLGVGNFFLANLVPVTIGNILGGGVLVGVLYWFLYRKDAA